MATRKYGRIGGLFIGFVVGLVLGGLWPQTPLHAVSTDRTQNIIVATGLVDSNVEAVFYLESLTGTLRGGVPSIGTKLGPLQASWMANVAADMAASRERFRIQQPSEPRYVMVTGLIDLRAQASGVRAGKSMVYVAEVNSGVLLAYMVPWSANFHESNKPYVGQLVLWNAVPMATGVIRERE
jgi:hypothetical protein